MGYRSVPREFVDPPAFWNPTVGLFLGGYALAALTIWGWFVAGWPLPVLLCTGFLALHLEGTVIHDACHNAAHPNRWINQAMAMARRCCSGSASLCSRECILSITPM